MTEFAMTKRDFMFTRKEHIIPELIKIQLVSYHQSTHEIGVKRIGGRTYYEVQWRFWRLNTDAIPRGGPPPYGWAGLNWGNATANELEAEQWFDLAVARVTSLIIMGKDITVDIMHDYNDMGLQIS